MNPHQDRLQAPGRRNQTLHLLPFRAYGASRLKWEKPILAEGRGPLRMWDIYSLLIFYYP